MTLMLMRYKSWIKWAQSKQDLNILQSTLDSRLSREKSKAKGIRKKLLEQFSHPDPDTLVRLQNGQIRD
jgi:hypothetical protein